MRWNSAFATIVVFMIKYMGISSISGSIVTLCSILLLFVGHLLFTDTILGAKLYVIHGVRINGIRIYEFILYYISCVDQFSRRHGDFVFIT